jgi:hypothetical protein
VSYQYPSGRVGSVSTKSVPGHSSFSLEVLFDVFCLYQCFYGLMTSCVAISSGQWLGSKQSQAKQTRHDGSWPGVLAGCGREPNIQQTNCYVPFVLTLFFVWRFERKRGLRCEPLTPTAQIPQAGMENTRAKPAEIQSNRSTNNGMCLDFFCIFLVLWNYFC